MSKCEDCTFGALKVLLGTDTAPCTRIDDEECPNYNEETGEIEMEAKKRND